MTLRVSRELLGVLLVSSALIGALAACGGDDAPPPAEDAGDVDAAPRDAGPGDASVDAGAVDAGEVDASDADAGDIDADVCADEDGDGYEATSCGGDDCDDALNTVNPGAAEQCNGGIDDDCDGMSDAADGVCVPCATGYTGIDGDCTNIDECAETPPCGAAVGAVCTDTPGSYICACGAGYAAPASGGTCTDVDECSLGTPCGGPALGCANTPGSYACTCDSGYVAPAMGGTCTDVDECALGTDDCDRDPAAVCANTPGGFTCACPAGFAGGVGAGHGVGGCLLSDASLSSLVPSAGALSPAFAGGTTTYTLTLPADATSIVFTPSVAYPARATVTVDGVTVASGAASAPISLPLGFAPRPVVVTVTTESGATQTYAVVVGRSPAYVKPSNTGARDAFGISVSLSADGTRLAVSAQGEASSATGVGGNQANNTAADSGAVYVFSRTGTTWTQEAYIKASNTRAGDWFGTSVSLSADGTRLAVGARWEPSSATGIGGNQADNSAYGSGAVYVFSRTGTTWTQEAYAKASNTEAYDAFGISVSLSSDGTLLAVGAPGEDSSATGIGGDQADNTASGSGAVYVFSRTGTTWTQEAYIKASNTEAYDAFGWAVSLSADGTRLAVGAYREESSTTGVGGSQADNGAYESGAVYVFSRTTGTTWTQEAYVKASNTGAGDNFGWSVSLSSDGTRLAVGASFEDSSATGAGGNQADNSALDSGAVYVFSRTGTTWTQEAYVKASNTATFDQFGTSVSLSADGTRLAVGARWEFSSATGIGGNQADDSAAGSGAAYVFSRTGTTWTQEAYAKASNTEAYDAFGISVSLSSDGTLLAVGAPGEDSSATGIGGDQADNGGFNSGAVYVY